VVCGVEKITFDTWRIANFLGQRLIGSPASQMGAQTDPMGLIPHHFFSQPGLWIGLAIAAIFLAVTVRLRRYRGPI
jgi:hypothetical protein